MYRIVQGKNPPLGKCPPPNFYSFELFFEVLRVTAHHAKFSRRESKVGQLNSVHQGHHSHRI